MRVDWPHIRSIESSISFDFDSVLRGIITGSDNPYLIRGFEIQIPDAAISANSLQVDVADTAILHSTSAESGTIFTIPNGTAADTLNSTNSRVIGAFQNGVTNFVSIELVRSTDPDSADQTAGWSEAQKSEFQRTVPIGTILDYKYIITSSGFSTNLPLYTVGVSPSGSVEYIQKSTPNLFRLGSGGTVPDPYSSFNFGGLSNPQNELSPRREWINENTAVNANPVSVTPGDDPLAFNYGDFSIKTLKQWMDAVMTRFKETTGSSYWYTDSSLLGDSIDTFDLWWDSVGSVMTGSGYISYNLILEVDTLTSGALQTKFTDSSILPGDSYVEGAESGNKGNLNAFNNTQLVVNSLIRDDFIFDEVLRNRRLWRPVAGAFDLVSDVNDADSETVGIMKRSPTNLTPTSVPITAWSSIGNLITITAAGHGYKVGDHVEVAGLEYATSDLDLLPNGVHLVKEVSGSTFTFSAQYTPLALSKTLSGVAETYLDGDQVHPYLPTFEITEWAYAGSTITITAPRHTVLAGDIIVVSGLEGAAVNPNGRFTAVSVTTGTEITFTAADPTSGTPTVNDAKCRYDEYEFLMTLQGSSPDTYEVVNIIAKAYSDTQFSYKIGTNLLPAVAPASGAIEVDGVVALSTVSNPARVLSVVNDGSGILTVTTSSPHGMSSATDVSFTIYGDQSLSPYIRTYVGMNINVVGPNVLTLTPGPNGTVLLSPPNSISYINTSGDDDTFVRFPDNPYPGPVQWDSDIIIKGVIGDKFFRIPQTATATGTAVANKFNINGLTGTAFLQDGEVAYIKLERNKSVSNGVVYETTDSSTITGPVPPVDENSQPLVAGDFVKFESDDEGKWLRIAGVFGDPVITNTFQLVSDNDQSPSIEQRPSASGRMLYAKTTYNEVTVQPHYLVEPSPDIYWLGVRRDNDASRSKVYFKSLELEAGEVRQINDNELSNHLLYTGAGTESAINPNYTVIDSGSYGPSEQVEVSGDIEDVDPKTRMITFVEGPTLGFEAEDQLVWYDPGDPEVPITYTIDYLISSRTVIVKNDITGLTPTQEMTFVRTNYNLSDSDNLTLATRKQDREQARINTALERPVYDESVYFQQMDFTGSGTIKSGSYIYAGVETNPTAQAWVLHGTDSVLESIEGSDIEMSGGEFGANSIIVQIYKGSFENGDPVSQNGAVVGTRAVTGKTTTGADAFVSPEIIGGDSVGVELVLPPNRRTEVKGALGDIVVFGSNATYKSSTEDALSGEELMIIANDSIREANIDYSEVFGGPKGKVKLLRTLPPKSRMRFRIMPAFGSALAKLAGNVTLQLAYNGGRIINAAASNPVKIGVSDSSTGGTALTVTGSVEINGIGVSETVGGIFGPITPTNVDQAFLVGRENNKPKEVWSGSSHVKSHSGYLGTGWVRKTAAGLSTSTSFQTITESEIQVPVGKSARIQMTAVARRTDGTLGAASFKIEGTFYNSAGTVLPAGSPTTIHLGGAGDGNQYAVSFGVSGDKVTLNVFGTNAPVQWAVGMDYQMIEGS